MAEAHMGGKPYFLWVEVLKAIGITAVVLGHSLPGDGILHRFIYSWHMPLFFFLAGYVCSCSDSILTVLLKRFDRLIIPYLIFTPFMVMAYQQNWSDYLRFNGVVVTWFFVALYLAEFLGRIFVENVPRRVICFMLIGLMFVGIFHDEIRWPSFCCFGIVFPSLVFWMFGHLVRVGFFWKTICHWKLIVAMCCVPLFLLTDVDMAHGRIGNGVYFYIVSFSCLYILMWVSRFLQELPVPWTYLSHRSILLMVLSSLVAFLTRDVFQEFSLNKITCRVLNLLLLLAIVEVLHRFVPILSGRMRILSRFSKD